MSDTAPRRTADYVARCQSVVAGIQCGRELGHRGQHTGTDGSVKATWTEKSLRKIVRP